MNPISPKRRRQNPIMAQRRLQKEQAAKAHKGSGQVAPPPPPANTDNGSSNPAAPSEKEIDKRKEALEMLPDADLQSKASALLHDYDEAWDRETLISRLLAAGVAG